MSAPLLQVNDLKKHFPVRGSLFSRKSNWVYAVDGVSFEVAPGLEQKGPRHIAACHYARKEAAAA